MYIKNKFKKDKRIASKRETKQIDRLFKAMYNDSQKMDNVLKMAKVFLEKNNDFNFIDSDMKNIIKTLYVDMYSLPPSEATLNVGVQSLERHYKSLKKVLNHEKESNIK